LILGLYFLAQKYWRKSRANIVGEIDPLDTSLKDWISQLARLEKRVKNEEKRLT
jgi:hypothetical protein